MVRTDLSQVGDYKVRMEEPKSHNGKRTLPFDDELVSALTAMRKRQAQDSEAAGSTYRTGLDGLTWYTPGDDQDAGPHRQDRPRTMRSLGPVIWFAGDDSRIKRLAGRPALTSFRHSC